MDMDSNCLNGGQKYKTYLSLPFSRKNRSYWLMCRKTQIFHILENMVHFQNSNSPQSKQKGSDVETTLDSSPRRDPYKTMKLYFEYIGSKIFAYILLTIWPHSDYNGHFVSKM